MSNFYDQRFSVAPMLDWTTRHCRAFHRQLSKNAVLYTEMVAASSIVFGKYENILHFRPEYEGEVILQLGGSDPEQFAKVAKLLQENKERFPYSGININVGCPSPRVTSGNFGACLMFEPELVAQCADALLTYCDLPVSIKSRIGVDDHDSFEFLEEFIYPLTKIGVEDFVIHARKAYLEGLSPKENREIPPLNYQRVYDIKDEFPDLNITINGGIIDVQQAREHLKHVDGVMIGREAYHNPSILLAVDPLLFNDYDNEFTRYFRVFDETIVQDQEYFLHPERVAISHQSPEYIAMQLKQSIFAGYNQVSQYNPLIEKIDHLLTRFRKKGQLYFKQALEEKRQYVFDKQLQPEEPERYPPRSEITDVARFKRVQQIATGQAMFDAIDKLRPYFEDEYNKGTQLCHVFKPILAAFNGLPGARIYRRHLSTTGFRPDSDVSVIFYALDLMYDKFLSYIETALD